MRDIENRDDIRLMVESFYEKVKQDELISFFFSDIAQTHWEEHIPVMVDFWDSIIFDHYTYSGNPMDIHRKFHEQSHFTKEHFERWLQLFQSNLDAMFQGPNTEKTRQRVQSIAMVMELKFKDN